MAIDTTKTINAAKVLADTYTSGTTVGSINVSIGGQSPDDSLIIASYDSLLDLLKVQEQSPLWAKNTETEPLVSAKDITGTTTQQGNDIDVRDYKTLGVYCNFVSSGSTGNTLSFNMKHDDGANDYVLETAGDYTKTIGDSDIKIAYFLDVEAVAYVSVWALTTGGGFGNLTIDIIKQY